MYNPRFTNKEKYIAISIAENHEVLIDPLDERYADILSGTYGEIEEFIEFEVSIGQIKDQYTDNINSEAQYFMDSSLPAYPDFEKFTFEIQKSEARSWLLDNSAQTPNVDILALNRGIDREVLLEKISIKATQFEQLSMAIAGQRQKFEDLINKATTIKELDEINISFTI
jgi:hypothetical protein